MPPIHAIRVKSCGKDWVTDTDTTLTVDKIRGFSLDDEGVHLYSKERDIHGDYDNVFVPYSNLDALVFYFQPTADDNDDDEEYTHKSYRVQKYKEQNTACDKCPDLKACAAKGKVIEITTSQDTRRHFMRGLMVVCNRSL